MDDSLLAEKLGVKHIGIIMDGNGRWAEKRLLPRSAGHSQGAKAFKNCLNSCVDLGVQCVTFYAFSTENWMRPKDEVDSLMKLFCSFMDEMMKHNDRNIRIRFLGSREALPVSVKEKMTKAEKKSADNSGMYCCIALNYGAREELLNAAKQAAQLYKSGELDLTGFDEKAFSRLLYTSDLPDVDLVIRPSGEMRLSNFLLWQAAYAELVFMDVLWPDFTKDDLIKALMEYKKRNRRFGGV